MNLDDAKSLARNKFKRHLIEGKVQIGLWLSMDSLFATEIVAGSGFDWLLLDMEHTSIDLSQVVQHLRAAKGGTAEVVVRIPWNEPIIVKRLLDAGANVVPLSVADFAAFVKTESEKYERIIRLTGGVKSD